MFRGSTEVRLDVVVIGKSRRLHRRAPKVLGSGRSAARKNELTIVKTPQFYPSCWDGHWTDSSLMLHDCSDRNGLRTSRLFLMVSREAKSPLDARIEW
jgi:hypothetical protein